MNEAQCWLSGHRVSVAFTEGLDVSNTILSTLNMYNSNSFKAITVMISTVILPFTAEEMKHRESEPLVQALNLGHLNI